MTKAEGARAATWPLEMIERYYEEYRNVARAMLARDAARDIIQPTELAHDAALRLFQLDRIDIAGRTHFLSLAARVMRQVLVDEVRRRRAAKRQAPVLTEWPGEPTRRGFDFESFDDALTRLAAIDPDRAWVVEQRFYAGLTLEEVARVSGRSESTVKRQWRVARAWLLEDLSRD